MDTASWHKAREALVAAALPHVPFDGWTERALAAGARGAGMEPAEAARLFPRGPVEAIEVYSAMADRAMAEAVAALPAETKMRERIAAGIRARLDFVAPHKEAARRATSALALPHNAPIGLRLLYRTVDALWYAAGDKATDFNFYTKRAILAAICSATFLYWFNDRSIDHAATLNFLERRLDEHARLHGAMERLKQRVGKLPNPFVFAERFRPDRGRGRRGTL
ncbi:MAG: COQ9 family protein [Candidatus Odyssella sp.]|nr:COQ9 family protein [Candidatus Odyssella sp.]